MLRDHQPRRCAARHASACSKARSLTVHAGHKVGLVGANGCGKSSLFALIRGELHPDAGAIELPPRVDDRARRAGDAGGRRRAALDYVLDGDASCATIEARARRRRSATPTHGGEALAELHHRYEAIGGYARARARGDAARGPRLRRGAATAMPVASFSGGWRMRLNLAQALMCRSDLLLLDEPTNHLDLDAVLWLEDWLAQLSGHAAADHARPRLPRRRRRQRSCTSTTRKLDAYTGNYAQFERERAQQLALQQATYEKQQRQIAHLQSFIDRFRAKATKAKQAQSRIKTLERMELHRRGARRQPVRVRVPRPSPRAARQLVLLEDVDARLRRPRRRCSRDIDWGILAGRAHRPARPQRRGQVDAAQDDRRRRSRRSPATRHVGAGPAHRLLRAAPGRAAARSSSRRCGTCAQLEPDAREQELRDFLGGFDFRGDMADARGRQLLRRREGAARARADRLPAAQPAAARRADQPPRHRDARGADRSAAGLRRRAGRGRARPPSAARDHRRAVARRRRQGRAVRRRPRRLPRLGAECAAPRTRRARECGDPGERPRGPSIARREARRSAGAPAARRRAQAAARAGSRRSSARWSALAQEKDALDAWLAEPERRTRRTRARRSRRRSRARASSPGSSRVSKPSGWKRPKALEKSAGSA